MLCQTNVASVGTVFNDTQKVKVLSLPETIKEKSTFRAKALCRELIGGRSGKTMCVSLEMRHISLSSFQRLSTLLALILMNVSLTFNAHLSLSDTRIPNKASCAWEHNLMRFQILGKKINKNLKIRLADIEN